MRSQGIVLVAVNEKTPLLVRTRQRGRNREEAVGLSNEARNKE